MKPYKTIILLLSYCILQAPIEEKPNEELMLLTDKLNDDHQSLMLDIKKFGPKLNKAVVNKIIEDLNQARQKILSELSSIPLTDVDAEEIKDINHAFQVMKNRIHEMTLGIPEDQKEAFTLKGNEIRPQVVKLMNASLLKVGLSDEIEELNKLRLVEMALDGSIDYMSFDTEVYFASTLLMFYPWPHHPDKNANLRSRLQDTRFRLATNEYKQQDYGYNIFFIAVDFWVSLADFKDPSYPPDQFKLKKPKRFQFNITNPDHRAQLGMGVMENIYVDVGSEIDFLGARIKRLRREFPTPVERVTAEVDAIRDELTGLDQKEANERFQTKKDRIKAFIWTINSCFGLERAYEVYPLILDAFISLTKLSFMIDTATTKFDEYFTKIYIPGSCCSMMPALAVQAFRNLAEGQITRAQFAVYYDEMNGIVARFFEKATQDHCNCMICTDEQTQNGRCLYNYKCTYESLRFWTKCINDYANCVLKEPVWSKEESITVFEPWLSEDKQIPIHKEFLNKLP